MLRPILISILALLVTSANSARATVIAYDITGSISSVFDDSNVYGGLFTVGMPFTGSLSYDTSMVDVAPSPTSGRYEEVPPLQLSMSLGGVDITTSPLTSFGQIVVLADTDTILTRINDLDSTGPTIDGLEFLLSSLNDSVITTDALPLNLDLADFEVTSTLSFTSGVSPFAVVFGQIETLTRVPEPGSAVLVGLGLLAICLQRPRDAASRDHR